MSLTVGVDVGQSQDPTAIVVLDTFIPEAKRIEERPEKMHWCRWIEKIPLGMNYTHIVERIAVVAEEATHFGRTRIIIDATGVGRPVVDMLRARTSISLTAVTITGASTETQTGAYGYRVPKRDLVSCLEVVLETNRLLMDPGIPLIEDLRAELGDFDFTTADNGRTTFDAASGKHDDLVMACALALWAADRGDNQGAAFVTAWRRMAGPNEHVNQLRRGL